MNSKKNEEVAKSLVSLVVAQMRKGAPRTGNVRLKTKNTDVSKRHSNKTTTDEKLDLMKAPSNEEVSEQLRKFENMVIIQRLDKLVDMQRMQWEILNRLTVLLETMTTVVADSHEPADVGEGEYSSTDALEEMISAQELADATNVDTPEEQEYEKAELFARKLGKVKNEVN
jgi:hypothetical protein